MKQKPEMPPEDVNWVVIWVAFFVFVAVMGVSAVIEGWI